jgi:hypothetical protein
VDSAVLTVELMEKPLVPQEHLAEFFQPGESRVQPQAQDAA